MAECACRICYCILLKMFRSMSDGSLNGPLEEAVELCIISKAFRDVPMAGIYISIEGLSLYFYAGKPDITLNVS